MVLPDRIPVRRAEPFGDFSGRDRLRLKGSFRQSGRATQHAEYSKHHSHDDASAKSGNAYKLLVSDSGRQSHAGGKAKLNREEQNC
jgi:hypothetical protein